MGKGVGVGVGVEVGVGGRVEGGVEIMVPDVLVSSSELDRESSSDTEDRSASSLFSGWSSGPDDWFWLESDSEVESLVSCSVLDSLPTFATYLEIWEMWALNTLHLLEVLRLGISSTSKTFLSS